VKITGEPSLSDLEHALAMVQTRHPLLRSRVVKDRRGIPWFATMESPPAIPVRLVHRSSDDDWLRESRTEWTTLFDTSRGPLIRIVWIKAKGISELLMVFHHAICNGGSAVCLMQEILNHWDQPARPPGREMEFITKEKLLRGLTIDGKARRKARLKSLMVGLLVSAKSLFMWKRKGLTLSREKDYVVNWKLNEMDSSTLLRRCRELEITMNTALCAAFLSAFRCICGSEKYQEITCPVDIRRYLPGLDKDDLFAFAMAINLPMQKNGQTSVWDVAAEMQKDAHEKMSKLDPVQYLLPMEYSHGTIRPLLKVLRYAKPGPGRVLLLSNMGRLEIRRQYRAFEVDAVYSFTVIGPFGDPTGIVASTFEGKMDFCLLSNEEVMPYADAQAIRQMAMELLISNPTK
jgi:NRPS condensation-like uncharacterized protein